MAWFRTRASAAVGLSFILAVTAACGGGKPPAKAPGEGGSSESNDKGPAEVGKAAPDLSIQTVNGKGQITRDSLQGKVAIVDFWATWCGPCKQSFPKLEELSKQNQGKVQVVGISVDDKSDGVADFAKSNGATFPIGWDDGHAIANRWKVDSMPTTYILDSSGTVRYIHAGYHDGEADAIAKELATLAAEPASGKAKTEVASGSSSSSSSSSSDAPAAGSSDSAGGDKSGDKTAAAGGDDSGDKAEESPPAKPKKGAGKGGKGKPAGKAPAKKPPAKKKPAPQ
jgi:cytochrome c biogenesis protein CcmG/thiol:disulfide interchange protein DsbE